MLPPSTCGRQAIRIQASAVEDIRIIKKRKLRFRYMEIVVTFVKFAERSCGEALFWYASVAGLQRSI